MPSCSYLIINDMNMDKKLISILFSGILLTAPLSAYAQYHSQVWNPDNDNGTYTNPVL